ncbi:LytR/AlgR family response regulator transcription factor [Natranaerobius thermophilus]|uniref:Stage 0 sporulation protein A homolog n=1 Tax=Natranaerobius thermophilus (strain ATCC BAA-1301 / DSM 18059 / JW/NM-WN-LF) TaxID=457570 RepID=B2A6G2_NATTJ|nr:LytTR family DNA-binding domain-containing protein [Natranaerobius thermophilus]ACB85495.1 two component transcriptional regulator, LytTR family [Natranaerobius thermophilus JW/NM-WN-LF]
MGGVVVLILEDEPYTKKYVKNLVSQNKMVKEIYDTESSREAVEMAEKVQPDIALIDIELTDQRMNGLETAQLIKQVNPEIEFIFVTAYSEYALQSFSVHPFDYLVKPIDEDKLLNSIKMLIERLNLNRNGSESNKEANARLIIEEPKKMLFIPLENILFLEKQKNKNQVLIHIQDGKIYETTKRLSDLEEELTDSFVRTHRSYIVNVNKVLKVMEIYDRSYEIEFRESNKKALLSRYKLEEFQEQVAIDS